MLVSPWNSILIPAAVAALLIGVSWRPLGARWVRLCATSACVGLFFLAPGDGWIFSAMLVALATSVLVGDLAKFGAPARTTISAVTVLAVLTPFAIRTQSIIGGIDELRQNYPLVSLRERLAYEAPPVAAPNEEQVDFLELDRQMNALVEDDGETEVDESQTAKATEARMRTYDLARLHSDSYRAFAASPGFGFRRMPRRHLHLHPLPPVAPTRLPPLPPSGPSYQPVPGEQTEGTEPGADEIAGMHREARRNFLAPEAFGYVQDLDHVAGFEPHAFRGPFTPAIDSPSAVPKSHWSVATLQLVSLLKHTPPRVYETDDLPDMSRLAGAVTRPIDEFERESLPQLASQEIVTTIHPNRIDMIGALRARKACLECHQGREGTLLGAFRYVLSRDSAVPEPKGTL